MPNIKWVFWESKFIHGGKESICGCCEKKIISLEESFISSTKNNQKLDKQVLKMLSLLTIVIIAKPYICLFLKLLKSSYVERIISEYVISE